MAYCRWSCDDFQCDLYVYESCYGGWEIHVAGNRYAFAEPLPPPVPPMDPLMPETWDAYWQRRCKVRDMLERATMEPITLPHVGETFCEATPGEAADRIESLIALGYRVPDHVVPALREEATT